MSQDTGTAREVYTQRLAARRAEIARLASVELAISNGRLAAAVAAAVLGWLAFHSGAVSGWWLAAPLGLFAILVVIHDRVIERRRAFERAAAFYEGGLARLDHLWMGKGTRGDRFLDESHLYAADLDLFGEGSLFELLCSARTRAGEETLAAWLLAAADEATIRARQAAIEELRDRVDLREDLAILATDVAAEVNPEALAAWGSAPVVLAPRPARRFAFVLAIAAVAAAAAWAWGLTGYVPFLGVLLAETAFTWPIRKRVEAAIAAVDRVGRDFALLALVMKRLERERFTSAHLVSLRAALDTAGSPPSARVALLGRLVELLDSRRNQLFAPFAAILLWGTQLALAIEAWREASGAAVARWLAAVGEMEALCSLAAYAYENPDYPFPVVQEGKARFEARRLGHPLIARGACVRNDLALDPEHRVLIVSGSNMSGKSTLLRAVGINAVLAMAGAPVCAESMRLSRLAAGASIRLHDSLQAGTSRFYAEIKRLRRIVDLAKGEIPALFLLDEVLNGTNSHDRRIGADAVVGELSRKGAIGLITTHDLALAHIAESGEAAATNVHFEDHIEEGRISFDYVMRPGIVTKSNGLALMRAVGLDVGAEAS